jgi:hypothetical protein
MLTGLHDGRVYRSMDGVTWQASGVGMAAGAIYPLTAEIGLTMCAAPSSLSINATPACASSDFRSPKPSWKIQYFERVEMVLKQGMARLVPLGTQLTEARHFPLGTPAPNGARRLFFPANVYSLSGRFLTFRQAHNGQLIYDPPISEPLGSRQLDRSTLDTRPRRQAEIAEAATIGTGRGVARTGKMSALD